MDTRLLHTFITLARTGSFTATAAELHLAQSTVTVQIRTLERELHTRLFDRLPTGAVPTESGRRLVEHAENVLEAQARLTAAAGDGGPVQGRVGIGATESLCAYRLPAVIAALSQTHPGIDPRLLPVGTAAAVQQLRAGQLDLALALEPHVEHPDLVAEQIGREPLVVVAAPQHPLAGRHADWAELASQSFFLLEEGCSHSDELASRLLAVPGAQPRVTRFGSIEAVRACVTAGLGLAQLPAVAVRDHLADHRLAVVEAAGIPEVPVWLLRHRRRWLAPATRVVIAELLLHNESGVGRSGP